MGVAHLRDAYPSHMSGGEMRRVTMARAPINSPKLLLADEPASNLDEKSVRKLMDLLFAANARGVSLLLVTHDMELAARSPRVMTMAAGKLAEAGRNTPGFGSLENT